MGSDGAAAGGEVWQENIRAGFRSLATRTKSRGPVRLVLPPHLTLTKFIKIPRVEPAQREKIVRFEAGQNIPYALTDVVWDSVVVGETPAEFEVLLATAKLEILDPLCAAAHEAGFVPQLVLPSAFATLAGFNLVQKDRSVSFLGLNLAPRSTTLLLIEPGRFALRTFALDLVELVARTTDQSRGTVEAAEGVKTKLLQEITRSLLHFQWRSSMGKPGQVCLTGCGARLPGVAEALTAKLSVPVDVPDLRSSIDFANDPVRQAVTDQAYSLIDLLGAAATQLLPNQPVVNLLPPRTHRRELHRKRRPWLAAAALLAATVLLPPLIHFRKLREEAQRKSAAIEHELVPLRLRDAGNQEKLRRLTAVNQQILFIQSTGERRTSWLRLLADLQERLDRVEDVWLEKLQIAPMETGAPMKLLVSGRMLDRANPLARVSPETFTRVKTLLAGLVDSPFVSAIEAERFNPRQPGILEFDFVIVADSRRPL